MIPTDRQRKRCSPTSRISMRLSRSMKLRIPSESISSISIGSSDQVKQYTASHTQAQSHFGWPSRLLLLKSLCRTPAPTTFACRLAVRSFLTSFELARQISRVISTQGSCKISPGTSRRIRWAKVWGCNLYPTRPECWSRLFLLHVPLC